ncbi:MAG TPA: hypothetical protein PK402_12160, partial [Tepidisphaeraceae bacterium]|nr:hypothetical protein [Tepidisphaeraceae bacterium]
FAIGPATVRTISSWKKSKDDEPSTPALPVDQTPQSLNYAHGKYDFAPKTASPWSVPVSSVLQLGFCFFLCGTIAIGLLASIGLYLPEKSPINPYSEHRVVESFFLGGVLVGFGLLLRSVSDGFGGILQVQRRLAIDNLLCIFSEIVFVLICSKQLLSDHTPSSEALSRVGSAYFVTGAFLIMTRSFMLSFDIENKCAIHIVRPNLGLSSKLFSAGVVLTLAQLADLLYAPFTIQLANRLLDSTTIADYSTALMMDAALLLLVAGISAPLLPRVTSAHLSGQLAVIRRYYLRASVASFAILLSASLALWAAWPIVMRLWIDSVPPGLSIILPLVLIHTTIGGASGIGRVVLIGMGKIRAWTISSLAGGLLNVALALLFTLVFHLGIRGIIFATIISVTIRCLIWMPWYILHHTGKIASLPKVVTPNADS